MTTSGRSPVSGLGPGRRSLLFGGLGGAAALAVSGLGAGPAAAAEGAEPAAVDFDLDTGNFLEWAQPSDDMAGQSPNADLFGPMDVTVFLWINRLTALAVFDALAPYHESAVGICSRIARRPSGESATNRNLNTAAIHATYQIWKRVLPSKMANTRAMMTALGLNPDDTSENLTSPVGIANVAAKAVWEGLKNDGMNFLGYAGGRRYNPRPWSDYTGAGRRHPRLGVGQLPGRQRPPGVPVGLHDDRRGVGAVGAAYLRHRHAGPEVHDRRRHVAGGAGDHPAR